MILCSRIPKDRRNLLNSLRCRRASFNCEARFCIIGAIKNHRFLGLNEVHSLDPILSEPSRPSGVYELRPVVGRGIIGSKAA